MSIEQHRTINKNKTPSHPLSLLFTSKYLPYYIPVLSLYYHLNRIHNMCGKQIWGQNPPNKEIVKMQKNLVHGMNNESYQSHTNPLPVFRKCQYQNEELNIIYNSS